MTCQSVAEFTQPIDKALHIMLEKTVFVSVPTTGYCNHKKVEEKIVACSGERDIDRPGAHCGT